MKNVICLLMPKKNLKDKHKANEVNYLQGWGVVLGFIVAQVKQF